MTVHFRTAKAFLLMVFGLHGVTLAQQPGSDALGLDSLLNMPISASGKYQQTAREAASSVTIITHDQIEQYGYRTLEDVFEGVSGFYLSNDRNYSYLGARGFSRPSDYNNRLLILLDGHSLNEGIFGAAPLELPIDLSTIERIEVVRGPGSALYGTGAVFGVINLVTRSGAAMGGTHAALRGGTYGRRGGSALFGRRTKSGLDLALSGTWDATDGHDAFYPQYDTPDNHYGIAHNLDWERRWLLQAKAEQGEVEVSGWFSRRVKAIPTAAFGMMFNAAPARTVDDYGFAEVKYDHALDASKEIRLRGFFDGYGYDGYYAYDDGVFVDNADDKSVGGEASLHWDIGSAQHLTAGAEYRRHFRASYTEVDESGETGGFAVPYGVASAYVEHEFQPTSRVTLLGGVRVDDYTTTGGAVTPRAAVLYDPAAGTTLKLLYGRAFRSPSLYEARIESGGYKRDPSLREERGHTLELVVQQRLGPTLLGTASVFRYHINGLIDLTSDSTDGLLSYRNVGKASASGAELGLEARLGRRSLGYANYTYQHARDDATGQVLSNSPSHLVKAGISASLTSHVGGALEGRVESGRATLYGTRTSTYTLTNLHLWFSPFESLAADGALQLSLRVNNLFDAVYSTPGGPEHVQPAIEQDRRNVSAELRYRF
jgi:outer membrane receptor protein involved in Fe transport